MYYKTYCKLIRLLTDLQKRTSSTDEDDEKDVSTKVPEGLAVLNLNEKLHGRLTFEL